ncbi:MAG: hypothetical protein E7375_01060 [Clostridiales bacterium]|nr:hypothetical protein [Clostridiales bacterium]
MENFKNSSFYPQDLNFDNTNPENNQKQQHSQTNFMPNNLMGLLSGNLDISSILSSFLFKGNMPNLFSNLGSAQPQQMMETLSNLMTKKTPSNESVDIEIEEL